ncbi:coiled-coil domain-containing protein 115 [Cololabis saira]|uniref:coiled-coil domain-containing protein 115 n=1 Tax=Cololabis saira TaxID=129043 RepID=UPI002AD353B9|nr:coiled-coil domain-containing protein 115 [Cololabis saira]
MGSSELEDFNELLDEKLLLFMDQLELLEEKRATLNSLIEQGWFSITKARYSMGNKQVSTLQYASEMEPLVCVQVRTVDNGEVEFRTEKCAQKCSEEPTNDVVPVEDIGPTEGVRRRNMPKKDLPKKAPNEDTNTGRAQRRQPNPQQDPLKWFGILVPQSLKQAQSSFKQVIDLSAEIAALQIAVLNTRQELKEGMKNKQTADERHDPSVGQCGKLSESITSEQEETKVASADKSH